MAIKRRSLSMLIFTNALIPIAILLFATGFFPYKSLVPGSASFGEDDYGRNATPPFDKVIFMVIDALRSDFVYSHESSFRFTQSLVRSGDAIPYTAHAASPTITMPRIKAITTGSIPSFLDVILNFAESDTTSSMANQDTWLSQLKNKPGGNLVMYGDDTWLKLFPGTFSRAEGTSSFFVSDFSEVDNNVTRHVPSELVRDDWNGMVMHYLGLDHIGHKSGPRSPNMAPKQLEMDKIIQQLYRAIETQKHLQFTLLVVCGDHGMNDAGNHGGSAEGETSPALLFISPQLASISKPAECPTVPAKPGYEYYSKIEQSDIAPTLAGLLGFPIPSNNLGVFIPEFLQLWPEDTRIRLMLQNARQMLAIVQGMYPGVVFGQQTTASNCTASDNDGDRLRCLWDRIISNMKRQKKAPGDEILEALNEFCNFAQAIMSNTASNYDTSRLHTGITIALVACLASVPNALEVLARAKVTGIWTFLVTLMYGTMMFASSFVEEEHHFWYWATSGWVFWLAIKQCNCDESGALRKTAAAAAVLAILRVARRWNQTGQKFAGEPDIARSFLPVHNYLLWLLVVLTYVDAVQRLARTAIPWASRQVAAAASVALGIAAFGFKVAFTNADAPELLNGLEGVALRSLEAASLVAQARTVFLSIVVMLLLTCIPILYQAIIKEGVSKAIGLLQTVHQLFTVFLITQSRAVNIPLLFLSAMQQRTLDYLDLSSVDMGLTSLLLQYTYFFAFGGSNDISSIDLSNAYNGVGGYNVIGVGVLTFVGNWAGPLWWTSATIVLLTERPESQKGKILTGYLSLLTWFSSSSILSVMLACSVLRNHLFIWTVFSPKYLYSMAWSLGQHICIRMVYGSLLFSLYFL